MREPAVDVTYVFYEAEEVAAEHNGLRRLFAERPDLMQGDVALLGEIALLGEAVLLQQAAERVGVEAGGAAEVRVLLDALADDGVADDDYILNATYQVDVGGTLVPASVSLEPLYDPTSSRIRS